MASANGTHSLVDVVVLQLHESGADGCNVALSAGKGDTSGAFGVLELRVRVDSRVTNATVQVVHDRGEFNLR